MQSMLTHTNTHPARYTCVAEIASQKPGHSFDRMKHTNSIREIMAEKRKMEKLNFRNTNESRDSHVRLFRVEN